jgi:hypothetical protein
MKSHIYSSLGLVFAVGLMSGCSGSDNVPIIPPSGPTAAVADDQRAPQDDGLTSQEAALVSQGNAEPEPPQKQDI